MRKDENRDTQIVAKCYNNTFKSDYVIFFVHVLWVGFPHSIDTSMKKKIVLLKILLSNP